jgi:hypothetical protein
MDMKEFKIRCSAIGQIMSNPRTKSEMLSKTCKTYVHDWLKEQIYGVQKVTSSKYTEKGLEVEDESISFFSTFGGHGYLTKNEKSYENEFLTGTPDIVVEDTVVDIKSSWDMWTFPLFEDDVPNKDYYWQLQGYMALTGATKAKLVYVLVDTPMHLLNNWTDVEYSYENVPYKYRMKEFEVERNDEDIDKIKVRVNEIREYIKTTVTNEESDKCEELRERRLDQ